MVDTTRFKFSPLLCLFLAIGTAFGQWKSLGGVSGTNGQVTSMLQVGDSIIVGGKFTLAGDQPAQSIAIWDGKKWHTMGDGFVGGCSKIVRTKAGKIYTVGFGTPFENKPLGYLETWTGQKWHSEDVTYNFETVQDIVVDSQDRIWISGYYYKTSLGGQQYGILIFDGESWTEIPNVYVYALTMGNSGEIYAGGSFSMIDGVPARNIAKFSEGSWSALGKGVNDRVSDLIVGKSGRLYALGSFDSAGTYNIRSRAMWDGDSWKDPKIPIGDGKFLYKDSEGRIYYSATTSVAEYIEPANAMNEGTLTWIAQTSQYYSTDTIQFFSAVKDKNGTLFLGGNFRFYYHRIENVGQDLYYSTNITKWDGTKGSSLCNGMVGPILDLSPGANGDLIATGDMLVTQESIVDKIGVWNGSALTGIPQALYAKGTNSSFRIKTATIWKNSIVVGGSFNVINVKDKRIGTNVAIWEGQSWTSLSSSSPSSDKLITSPQGELIAGAPNGAWKWSGTEWSLLGSSNDISGDIYDMAWDASGHLWVAGNVKIGSTSLSLAMWNGTSWVPQGAGVNGTIYSIAIGKDGNIYVGGNFRFAYNGSTPDITNRVSLSNLGIWNGKSWQPIGNGTNGIVDELLFDPRGNLLVGGNFSTVSNADGKAVPAGNLALWNGAAWSTFGSGTNGPVTAMGFDKNGKLLVSGNFTQAGDVVSAYMALLDYPTFLAHTRKPGPAHTRGSGQVAKRYTLKGERIR